MVGIVGLALVILSWVLTTSLLWSEPALASMYGQFFFGLTTQGWTVVDVAATLGFAMLLYSLLSLPSRLKVALGVVATASGAALALVGVPYLLPHAFGSCPPGGGCMSFFGSQPQFFAVGLVMALASALVTFRAARPSPSPALPPS